VTTAAVLASTTDNDVGLGLAVLLLAYLVAALVFPEKF
jgi:K+-transporting ATPase KdpF subunit